MELQIFGSYTSEEWKPLGKYYGNGECFVFQVRHFSPCLLRSLCSL